jgi:hypothetical protein
MSDVAASAHVHIIMADYAVADAGGKLTIVGGSIAVIGTEPGTGLTAPFAVVVMVTFDPAHIGESPAVELLLEDENEQLVALPGAVGELGQPQYLRVGVTDQLKPTTLPNHKIPTEAARPRIQILLNFQAGLPLPKGQRYKWRVRVDGESRDEWTEWLYIPKPTPGPVVG